MRSRPARTGAAGGAASIPKLPRRTAACALPLLAVFLGAGLPVPGARAMTLPRFGGAVVRGYVGELRTLAPLAATSALEREASHQVHAGLYRLDAEGAVVPELVEREEIAHDGRSIRLTIRQAWFHGGRAVGTADVLSSLAAFVERDPAGALLRGTRAGGEVATAQGERDVVLRIESARGLWRRILARPGASVLPAGDASAGTDGAGPFRVVAFTPGGSLLLAPFERFPRGRPYLDRVEYRRFPDERALLLAHRHQGVDVIGLEAGVASGTSTPPGSTPGATNELVLLRLNEARAPLDGLAVREAVASAVRLDALVDVVLGGRAERARGLLALRPGPALERERSAPGAADVARPLGRAGAAPGPEASAAPLALVYPQDAGLRSVAERLRVDLHAAGLAVRPEALGSEAHAARLREGRFDLALVVVPAGGAPPPLELADVAAALGRALPAPLLEAAASWGQGELPLAKLLAAEQALLAGGVLRPLFRRQRGVAAREGLMELALDADGAVRFETVWRWPGPP